MRHRSSSPTTISCPFGVELSSARNLPSTVVAFISLSWSRKPSTSACGNCCKVRKSPVFCTSERQTFRRVFAAATDRSIDTSRSWIGVSAGDKFANRACTSASVFRQVVMRLPNKVMRWGEYVSSPRRSVSCIRSRLRLTESRSLAEKKAASLRWSRRRCTTSAF